MNPKKTILLADDESGLMRGPANLLHFLGFSVIQVESAVEAKKCLLKRNPVHGLITDVHFPAGLSGADLVSWIIRERESKRNYVEGPLTLISQYPVPAIVNEFYKAKQRALIRTEFNYGVTIFHKEEFEISALLTGLKIMYPEYFQMFQREDMLRYVGATNIYETTGTNIGLIRRKLAEISNLELPQICEDVRNSRGGKSERF